MEDRELFSKLEELGGELIPPERLRPGAVEQASGGCGKSVLQQGPQ